MNADESERKERARFQDALRPSLTNLYLAIHQSGRRGAKCDKAFPQLG